MATDDKKFNMALQVGGLFLAVFVGISAYLLTLPYEVKATQKDVQEIKQDYLPYWAFVNVMDLNQKMINLITTIDQTTKEDPRYQKALQEWNDLQVQIIKQAGLHKRGASGQSQAGGE